MCCGEELLRELRKYTQNIGSSQYATLYDCWINADSRTELNMPDCWMEMML